MNLVEFLYSKYHESIPISTLGRKKHYDLVSRCPQKPFQFRGLIIIKLYCHIQRALHDELECGLALTHIGPIYKIK